MIGTEEQPRVAVVALAGAPNAGKSTLLNRILGQKLSIATAKPQTTRRGVIGVASRGSVQLVLTDTPGVHRPRSPVDERSVRRARSGISQADITCWLVAADRGLGSIDRRELAGLAERALLVVLNKVDLVARPRLLPIIAEIDRIVPGAECIPTSARTGDNVELLCRRLGELAPPGKWLYPADALTDQPMRFFAAELVREQLLEQLQEEVPYHTAVKIERYEEKARLTVIDASIFTDSESARKIIIGRQGARIKAVGTRARKAIESLTGRRVHLELYVRVKKDWQRDGRFLDELGL